MKNARNAPRRPCPAAMRGLRHVAVLVGEGEIVQRPDEAAVDRPLRGAVEAQPLPAVVVVDGVEAARIGQQPEAEPPADHRQHHVDDLPDAAELVVAADQLRELIAQGRGHRVMEAQEQVLRIAAQRGERDLHQPQGLDRRGERGELPILEEA